MSRVSGILLGAAAAIALTIGSANATPYSDGSFTFLTATTSTADILTTTSYGLSVDMAINGIDLNGPGSGFASEISGQTLLGSSLTFTTAGLSSFDFTSATLGTFVATSITASVSSPFPNASITYDVFGHYTVGSDWDNAGTVLTGDETWTLNQTGDDGSVSIGGTFNSPATFRPLPEPATLALMGAGLVGFGASRRRKKQA